MKWLCDLLRTALISLSMAMLGGCGGDASPTEVSMPPLGPTLRVAADSTATQLETEGLRIQVRFAVTQGALAQAAGSRSATARVCLAGTCVETPVVAQAREGTCDGRVTTDASNTRLGVALAWAEGNRGGVDFCVADLDEPRQFVTTVTAGASRSNAIQTLCLPGGFCGSD